MRRNRKGKKRNCHGCTVCCYTTKVWEGKKTITDDFSVCPHQKEDGCGIWERRPDPCAQYDCMWRNNELPPHFYPDDIGAVAERVGKLVLVQVRDDPPSNFDTLVLLIKYLQKHADLVFVSGKDEGELKFEYFCEDEKRAQRALSRSLSITERRGMAKVGLKLFNR